MTGGQSSRGGECFTAECARAEAFLFVTRELNRSLPAVLKSAIDWGLQADGAQCLARQAERHERHLARRNRDRCRLAALHQIIGVLGASVVGGEAYVLLSRDVFDAEGIGWNIAP